MSFPSLLDNKANVERETLTADGQGGYTSAWTTIFWNVPCRFEHIDTKENSRLMVEFEGRNVYPEYYIYCTYRKYIEGDKFVDRDGSKYIVVLVRDWSKQKKIMRLPAIEEGRNK